jgi:hypothetical protein
MGRINAARLIVSGFVIGALTNIGYALVMAYVLLWPWKGALAAISRPPFWINEVLILLALGFVAGFGAAWTYAGILPRFGPGPRTAFYVALAVWCICHVTVFGFCIALGLPADVMAMTAGLGLIISIVATLAGAALYREEGRS